MCTIYIAKYSHLKTKQNKSNTTNVICIFRKTKSKESKAYNFAPYIIKANLHPDFIYHKFISTVQLGGRLDSRKRTQIRATFVTLRLSSKKPDTLSRIY